MKMRRKKTKRTKAVLPIVLLGMLMLVSGFLYLRLRHGTYIKAKEEGTYSGEVVSYRQDDERWAKESLGSSSFTMESSGCLVTCIASAVSTEENRELTPGEVNRLFSEHNVYDSEGNVRWSAIEEIEGYSAVVFSEVSESGIRQSLESGHFPIVRVRVHGFGGIHYVLIVGIEGQDYICMDPLEDELTKLSHYLNRVYAVRVVYPSA